MMRALLHALAGAPPALPPAPEAELALAALLVRLARADDDYGPEERLRIDLLLAARRGLEAGAAAALRAEAEALEADAPDTVRFTRALKEGVALEDRIGVIEALWEVALADGRREAEEEAQIRLVAGFLGISDRDSAFARRRVLDRSGGS